MKDQVTEASISQSARGGEESKDVTESMHKSLHCCKGPRTRVVSPGLPTRACTKDSAVLHGTAKIGNQNEIGLPRPLGERELRLAARPNIATRQYKTRLGRTCNKKGSTLAVERPLPSLPVDLAAWVFDCILLRWSPNPNKRRPMAINPKQLM